MECGPTPWAKVNEPITQEAMNMKLVTGTFSHADAMELLQQLVQVKLRFHEEKVSGSASEEDIKMRERRIKQLQEDLHELLQAMKVRGGSHELDVEVRIKG